MERRVVDLWVGLFVVAGFIALMMLALKVGNFGAYSPDNTYVVKAHFDNIGGLKEQAPVRSSGVVVGRVTGIRFDTKKFDAEVTLSMDSKFQVSDRHDRSDFNVRHSRRKLCRPGSGWRGDKT